MSSNQGGKDSISSSKAVSLVETWGQAVVPDNGSADHGISIFPGIFLMEKKSFLVGKWVAYHL